LNTRIPPASIKNVLFTAVQTATNSASTPATSAAWRHSVDRGMKRRSDSRTRPIDAAGTASAAVTHFNARTATKPAPRASGGMKGYM
jgi:hypothetical protein